MKNELVFDISQILYRLFKFSLGVIFIYIIIQMCLSDFSDFRLKYDEYFKIRGMETYGLFSMAILDSTDIDANDKMVYTYKYIVDDKEYFLISNQEYSNNGANEIGIYYDSLKPDIAVEAIKLNEISTFYSNTLLEIIFLYFINVIYVCVFGLFWYLLDLLWYNKINPLIDKRNKEFLESTL